MHILHLMQRALQLFSLLLFSGIIFARPELVSAQTNRCFSYVQQQKLIASDGLPHENFGSAVAISGTTIVVGVASDRIGNNNRQGSAHTFVRTGTAWGFHQKLTAPDGAFDDRFGISLAISGDTMVIGANLADVGGTANTGAVYVFQRTGTTWGFAQKLTALDGINGDNFGASVSIHKDTILVGAPGGGIFPNEARGSAYVFTRAGSVWSFQQKLVAADSATGDSFGQVVRLSGETGFLGAPGADNGANFDQGAVYVWGRSGTTWSQQQKLMADDGSSQEYFGAAIALDGETAAIGVAADTIDTNVNQGSAYVFVRTGSVWSLQQKITAMNGETGDQFARKIALNGNTLVVSVSGAGSSFLDQGQVYVYGRTGSVWNELQRVMTAEGYGFGEPYLALDGGGLVVGAPVVDINQGAVYVFTCSPCPAIKVSPPALPFAVTGNFYSRTLTATGGTSPYSFALSVGSLPPGLSLSSTGTLSGTTNAAGNSTFYFSVLVTDANGCKGVRAYEFSVAPQCTPILLYPEIMEDGFVGTWVNMAFSALGGSFPYSYSLIAGSLPPGIILRSGTGAGSLWGNPTTAGTYNFIIQVTDHWGCVRSRSYTWRINPACSDIIIGPVALSSPTAGVFYTQTLTQSGGVAPVSWKIRSGTLPPGLTLDPTGGVISGIPRQIVNFTAGYSVLIQVKDANNCANEKEFSLPVAPSGCIPLTLIPEALPGGVIGSSYNEWLEARNSLGDYTFQLINGTSLPSGLSLSADGHLTGVPSAGTQGEYVFMVSAVDVNGCMGSRTYTINISACGLSDVNPQYPTVPGTGGIYSFNVSAPNCNWTAFSHTSWLTVTNNATGYGNQMISYRVSPNPGTERTGSITVNNYIVRVTQSSGDAAADFDSDGIPNGVELNEGTHPEIKDNNLFANTFQGYRLFVMQQYRDFLGREGDVGGVNYWVNTLNTGSLTRAQVIDSFFNSPEFQNYGAPVVRLYYSTFNRPPDYAGFVFHSTNLRSGTPLAVIGDGFAASPEFQSIYGALSNTQFITLLYQNALRRTPAQAEISYWLNVINSGISRGTVLMSFSESPESRQLTDNKVFVVMMYIGMLRRAPAQSEVNYWQGIINGPPPVSRLSTTISFSGSTEYRNRFLP